MPRDACLAQNLEMVNFNPQTRALLIQTRTSRLVHPPHPWLLGRRKPTAQGDAPSPLEGRAGQRTVPRPVGCRPGRSWQVLRTQSRSDPASPTRRVLTAWFHHVCTATTAGCVAWGKLLTFSGLHL